MVQYIEVKSILSKLRNQDDYFGITYNMNLYRNSNFPQIKERYHTHFGEQYECMSLNYRELKEVYKTQTQLLNLKTKMDFYKQEVHKQLSLF